MIKFDKVSKNYGEQTVIYNQDLIKKIHQELKLTIIFVTHDMAIRLLIQCNEINSVGIRGLDGFIE